ncbi:MAG: LysR family transcriptional regulator, partial [Paracoccaceae bacterium]
MDYLHRSLPPLDPLVAFEAAARLGSFTRAAEELDLSQAAVSQRIRQLEDHLDAPLFVRANRKVTLTAAGQALQQATGPALGQIAATSDQLRARASGNRLSIAVDPTIASIWLMPRLSRYRDEIGEDLSLHVTTTDDVAGLSGAVDLTIQHGTGKWPGRDAALLFSEDVFPVCAPDYLMHH